VSVVPGTKARRVRRPLLAALGVLALLALGWWLAPAIFRVEPANGTLVVAIDDEAAARIKDGRLILIGPDDQVRYTLSPGVREKKIDPGSYRIRVERADGLALGPPEFTLEKGGQVTVRVKAIDPDRTAAEYVLSLGGAVQVNGQPRDLTAAADLPRGSFRLTGVVLKGKKVDDAGLANFKGCKGLTYLNLWYTQVSNAGLAHFKDCKGLTSLILQGSGADDSGLAHFKDCKHLTDLHLGSTKVGDAGLAYFKDCKDLTLLSLWNTQVGDAGLAYFKGCKNLTTLCLNDTQVSDAGLAHFKDCKDLTTLDLGSTTVGDAGLANFKDCKGLTYLDLGETKVSDAGLAHFKDCKGLTSLDLRATKVSDAGLAYFKDCKDLTFLNLVGTKVIDIAPLKRMPLIELRCDFKAGRDAEVLRSIKTLQTINGKPAKEFWAEVDARKP
jgi:uncharacterized membrane protein